MDRQRIPAVSPFAATVGYSRAIRAGDRVWVAGTAAVLVGALAEVGAEAEHVDAMLP